MKGKSNCSNNLTFNFVFTDLAFKFAFFIAVFFLLIEISKNLIIIRKSNINIIKYNIANSLRFNISYLVTFCTNYVVWHIVVFSFYLSLAFVAWLLVVFLKSTNIKYILSITEKGYPIWLRLIDEAVILYFYLITLCTHRFPTINLEISSLNSLFAIVTIHLTFSMPCNWWKCRNGHLLLDLLFRIFLKEWRWAVFLSLIFYWMLW